MYNTPTEYKRISSADLQRLKDLPKEERMAVCKGNFALFSAYYFMHTKKYPFAKFHYSFFQSFRDLLTGDIMELLLLAFRESAKTSLVKEFVIYLICYNLEEYIVWDSYDVSNSRRALFDIVVELQTNKRIKDDFGELYNQQRSMSEKTQKSVGDFVTNNIKNDDGEILRKGIRVEAHSTQEPARGFLHGGMRPGFVIIDDFENKKTIRSEAMTSSIWEHMQELKGGIDGLRFRIIYLGNYISAFANIQKILDRQAVDPYLRVHLVPVIKDGVPTWFEKYVMSDAEADYYKEANPNYIPKISLEKKKRSLWSPDTGDIDWEAEMMCNPIDNTLAKFKREYFQYISLEEVLKKKVVCFVVIDPAISEKDTSDDTGVSIIWTDDKNFWYSKVFKLRLNSLELINFLFKLHDALLALGTPARRIGMEKEKYYSAVYPFLKEKMREKNVFLPMYAIEIKGRGKEDRITNGLQYRYENGVIFHVMGEMMGGVIPNTMSDYETQAQRFPAGGHDDMLDSHAYGADIVRYDAPESQEEKKAKANPYNIDNFVQKIEDKAREAGRVQLAQEEERKYRSAYEDDQISVENQYFSEIE